MNPPEPFDYLGIADLLEIGAGVLEEVAVGDHGLLASAVGRPQVTVFGEVAYVTLADKAAALTHSIARNHALVDGNMRLAWAAARTFCLLNGSDLRYDVDDAEALVLGVAAGTKDVPEIADWIRAHLIDD